MMNYLKGYNGRNIRNGSWLEDEIMKRGEEYAQRIMGKSNMRAKMENWENVRRVVSNDRKCREFVKDFEVVVGYYFEKIQEGRKKTIGKNCNSRGYEDN